VAGDAVLVEKSPRRGERVLCEGYIGVGRNGDDEKQAAHHFF
jgi:hypothetical protein